MDNTKTAPTQLGPLAFIIYKCKDFFSWGRYVRIYLSIYVNTMQCNYQHDSYVNSLFIFLYDSYVNDLCMIRIYFFFFANLYVYLFEQICGFVSHDS